MRDDEPDPVEVIVELRARALQADRAARDPRALVQPQWRLDRWRSAAALDRAAADLIERAYR